MPATTTPPRGTTPMAALARVLFWGAVLATVAGVSYVIRGNVLGLGRFSQTAAVLELIQSEYVEETSPDDLTRATIAGMLGQLDDPNSLYVPPGPASQFQRRIRGDYVGIGVQIVRRDGFVTVVTPIAGSPAARAGVLAGDRIVAVEGVDVTESATDEVVTLISGPKGEAVRLDVDRDGAIEQFDIVRDDIRTESVKGLKRLDAEGAWRHALDADRGIAYVRITQFTTGTTAATAAAIERARTQLPELRGLVLDLRGNPGGIIDEAAGVADLFVRDGAIVSTQRREQTGDVLRARPRAEFDGPVLVLIDGASASGSEIVAGALLELRGESAAALGTRTFGKGSVQGVYNLPDGGTLKLTEAMYALPSGRIIQRQPDSGVWGVDPSPGMLVPLRDGDGPRLGRLYAQLDEVGAADADGGVPADAWDSPAALLSAIDDPQLAAAHAAMLGKLETGGWLRVGGDPLTGTQALRLAQAQRALDRIRAEERRLVEEIERLSTGGGGDDAEPDAS
ncbi:MAG: S41 family peptidase [Planctomycetota bacterium]